MGNGAVTGGLSGGGADLGAAHGTVTINLADLQRAAQTARTLSQQIEQSFGGIDRGTQRAERSISTLGASVSALGGAFGVAFGAQQIARYLTGVNELSTAYARQNVAALSLAGSQQKLNALLASYDKVTGGAVAKAETLSQVTQLQAIGFADTTAELERFVTASRGISLATGRSQEFVVQQLQLAIANQSTMRLDQIGLGVEEVQARVDKLKTANNSLSDVIIYQNAVLGLAEEKYGALAKSVEAQATGLEKARKAWADLSLEIGESLGPATGGVLSGLTGQLQGLQNMLKGVERDALAAGNALRGMGGGKVSPLPGSNPADFLNWDPIGAGADWLNNQLGLNQTIPTNIIGGSRGQGRGRGAPILPSEFTGEQMAAQRQAKIDFEQTIQDIERSAQEQRLDTTRSYESQRTETIANYGRQIAREAEDFARQRARAEAQFARQVLELRESAAKRESDWLEDLQKRIARLSADSGERIAEAQEATNERIAEIDEDYRRNRERAERQHKDNLLDAAARLDATAVFNERKRFAREQQDAQEAHRDAVGDAQEALQERIDQERENLAERIAQEQDAHRERLEDAREADAERLADMQRDFEEQKRLEDEDRAVRLQRMAEDHAAQLASMASAHAEQLAEIERSKAEELKANQEAHLKDLEAAGLFNKQWKAIQDARQAEALRSWDQFWSGINARFAIQGPQISAEAARSQWEGINLADPANSRFPVARSGGSSSRSLTVAPGGIVVYAAPGQSAEDIATVIDRHLVRRFQELAQ